MTCSAPAERARARRRRGGWSPTRACFFGCPSGPLDWEGDARLLRGRSSRAWSTSDGVYRRTVVIDGDPGVLELSLGGPDHLLLLAHLPHWEGLIHVVRRARRIFNLDQDAGSTLGADPVIGPLVRARPGSVRPGRGIRSRPCSSHHRSRHRRRCEHHRHSDHWAFRRPGPETATPRTDARVPGAFDPGPRRSERLGLTAARAAAVSAFARAGLDLVLDRAAPLDELAAAIGDPRSRPLVGSLPRAPHGRTRRIPGERSRAPPGTLPGPLMATGEIQRVAERWRPWRALAATQLWLAQPRTVRRLAS